MMTDQLTEILQNDLGVSERYQHTPKWVTPGESITTNGGVLKWYALHPKDEPVPDDVDQLARRHLAQTPLEAKGLGFVILHRCNNDFYFLIVSTWRGNNEVWETLFYKDGDRMNEFALWPRDAMHKPTYCVWELAPVWHEKESWERFLMSPRDEPAAKIWQKDVYAGAA